MWFDPAMYIGFIGQLRKTGAPVILPSRLSAALTSAGALAGVGAGAGAAAGGLHGAYSRYQDARAQGGTVGQSLAGGVAGAGAGAVRGAAIGGTIGGIGGAGFSAVSRQRAESLRKALTERSAVARFGQRQVHGVTGAVPEGGLASLKMDAGERLKELERARTTDVKPGWLDKRLGRSADDVKTKRVSQAEKAHQAAQEAEDQGMTSLPGIARSIGKRGVLPTLNSGVKTQLYGADPAQKALFLAGTGMTAANLAKREEGETGMHHAGRVAKGAGGIVLNTLTGGLPAATQMGVDTAARSIGPRLDRAGRTFRRAKSKGRDLEHGRPDMLHEEPGMGASMELSPRMSEGGQA